MIHLNSSSRRKPSNASRYVLCPGNIRSKIDGDIHFIGSSKLAELYKLDIRKCVIWNSSYRPLEGDIYLFPRYFGDYNL